MTLRWCKLLRFIPSVAWWLLGVLRTRARCGAGRKLLAEGAASGRSHQHASWKLALRSPLARAGVLGVCDIGCAGVSPVTEVGDRLRAFWSNIEHFLRGPASSMKEVKLCLSRACLVWTCLIPGAFGQLSLPFGTSTADDQCSLEGPSDRAAESHSGWFVLDVASDYFNDILLLALFLVIVLLAYRAALVFGWHQGCRFILVRRAIRAERFERLLEQKSEECNQKGSEILALQAHIRDLRGHLSNAQPELLRALHDEQAKSRGLARELQLYEDSFFDKNQQLIALERHIRELQEVLRGYESLRRSGHRVMTRAYNELEHHYNRYHRHGEIFVANRGAVWHWDGTCYKLQTATVRELWPCTSCANDVMTPHIPNEHGVSLEALCIMPRLWQATVVANIGCSARAGLFLVGRFAAAEKGGSRTAKTALVRKGVTKEAVKRAITNRPSRYVVDTPGLGEFCCWLWCRVRRRVFSPMPGKVVSAEDAVARIRDGSTVATGGFVGIGFPEDLAVAVEQRFQRTGAPRNLTLMYAAGQGDGREKGANHFSHEGLVKRVVGGHWSLVPKFGEMAMKNQIEDSEIFYDLTNFLKSSNQVIPPELASHPASKFKPGTVNEHGQVMGRKLVDQVVFAKK
eukprot:s4_g15.t1